jgi:hypothetical protein
LAGRTSENYSAAAPKVRNDAIVSWIGDTGLTRINAMPRRGFFAEIQHQLKQAEKQRAKDERERERQRKAMIAEAKRAKAAEERAAKQLVKAEAEGQKQRAKEAREAHIAAKQAEVNAQNLALSQMYDEIDSLLAATLDVDDYVDLEKLRSTTEHPPFERTDLESPLPVPTPPTKPSKPKLVLPPEPKGIQSLLGKKKHGKAREDAYASYRRELERLRSDYKRRLKDYKTACKVREENEPKRVVALKLAKAQYADECSKREAKTAEHNRAIDALIADLGYGVVEAVEAYIAIVLSNSVYPEHFPVEHGFEFTPESAELKLRVSIPEPDKLSVVKAFKYTKSSDEITSTTLSQKACKDRYTCAVHQVALRSLHEVFEADRRAIIKTISLEVGTSTNDPATGRMEFKVFVAVAAERESFLELNLAGVDPPATLEHLGAAVSRNPYGLVVADTSGIRRS